MWIFGLIQTIEKLCLELTESRHSQLHSSTVGADRQRTSREDSAAEHQIRTGRHKLLRHDIVTTRHETTENALGGSYQGTDTKSSTRNRKSLRDLTSKKNIGGQTVCDGLENKDADRRQNSPLENPS